MSIKYLNNLHQFIKYLKLFKLAQMETDKFQAALQILQRPINCLVDDDRNIRKEGLSTINK